MRVTFLGSDRWSVPSLEALAGSAHDLVLVVTRAPKPAGRGAKLTPTAVAEAARDLGSPLAEVETVRSGPGFEALQRSGPDVLVVVAYGEILPPAVLELPTVAPVNLHFSLLPELRGAAPVQRSLLEGMTATGLTTIRMDEGMDTGPILLRAEEAIDPEDDAGALGERLAAIGARLLLDTIDRLAGGALTETPQDDAGASFAPKLTAEDRWLAWTRPATELGRRVRAMSPEPGASTRFRDDTVKIFRAATRDEAGEPGTVVATGKEGFVIAAGEGSLAPLEVGPAGRKRMSAAEFVRGYRPEPGERFS
ncbi:MAG: methionyl-tRNA formyltransferase [Actinomycetota bacterium]